MKKDKAPISKLKEPTTKLTFGLGETGFNELVTDPEYWNDKVGTALEKIQTKKAALPKKFNQFDKSTYPSNPKQKRDLNNFEIMVKDALVNRPQGKEDIENRNYLKRILNTEFYKYGSNKMSDDELKLIGKRRGQNPFEVEKSTLDQSINELSNDITKLQTVMKLNREATKPVSVPKQTKPNLGGLDGIIEDAVFRLRNPWINGDTTTIESKKEEINNDDQGGNNDR